MECTHPATRLYAWHAYDGTLCVCCCDCGAVLSGAADESPKPRWRMYTIVRYPTGAYGLYSQDGFLHIDATVAGILGWAERLGCDRRRLAFQYW